MDFGGTPGVRVRDTGKGLRQGTVTLLHRGVFASGKPCEAGAETGRTGDGVGGIEMDPSGNGSGQTAARLSRRFIAWNE